MADISTKPYLIRAIHEWCEDSGYRPYIAVVVDERTQVPSEFVRNGEIVLNVSAQATHLLSISNELIEFEARFSGAVRGVSIPIDNVSAIYAQENGHGMAFDVVRTQSPRPAPARPPSPAPSPVASREASPPEGRRVTSVPRSDAGAGSGQSARNNSTKPRLVPKVAALALERQVPVAEPVAEKIGAEPSQESESAAARKPRALRRRSKLTAPPDTASGDPAAPQKEPKASAPTAALDPVTGAHSDAPAPAGSGGPANEPPNAPPAGPGKPARGHLKRVK